MKKRNVIILVLLMVIGFAAVSTTLVINGTFNIGADEEDFDIYFSKAVTEEDGEAIIDPKTRKTITYTTKELKNINDKSRLDFKVRNDSTQYDANIVVNCALDDEDRYKDYIAITPNEEEYIIDAQSSKSGYIEVELIQLLDEINIEIPFTCELEVNAVGRGNIVEKLLCNYENGHVWNFPYTGEKATFKIPCSGEYKLEVWGAQGGVQSTDILGSFGGYAKGEIDLQQDDILYIYVGGKGKASTNESNVSGGYNGGAKTISAAAQNTRPSSGGGATHIAFVDGLLNTLEENKDEIIIVAGGGGGSAYHSKYGLGTSGSGGGYKGADGKIYTSDSGTQSYGKGGTQTEGGKIYTTGADNNSKRYGSFGEGASWAAVGAGGGFYGGGAIGYTSGGGSGYIGNPQLKNKAMYCYDCDESEEENTKTIRTEEVEEEPISETAKKSDGYAKITLISYE